MTQRYYWLLLLPSASTKHKHTTEKWEELKYRGLLRLPGHTPTPQFKWVRKWEFLSSIFGAHLWRAQIGVGAALCLGQNLNPKMKSWVSFWETVSPLQHSICSRTILTVVMQGLHLTPKGYEIMYRETTKAIHDYYPELKPYNLPFIFPVWEHAPRYEEWRGWERSTVLVS